MTSTPITIYRLRVALADITPPIWRVIEVPADFSLDWLHSVIQWAMGWEHERDYRFHRQDLAYIEGPVSHEQDPGMELDATQYTLQKVYGKRGRYLRYVYDIGDRWWHHVWLEDAFHAAPETRYPRLIDGARACPPEGFGGILDYEAFLRGELGENDDRREMITDFDPDDFDSTPRPFPNANIYESGDEPQPPKRPKNLAPIVAEMLGEKATQADDILDATDGEFRADLRRSIEDIVLVEDALPPQSADTLQKARQMDIGLKQFLVACVYDHERLRENLSTAPVHAAHLLAFWKVSEAVDVFEEVLLQTPDTEEGLVDTLLDALISFGDPGAQRLMESLDEMSEPRRMRAVEKLCGQGVRDERIFLYLQEAMKNAGPKDARIPLLLSQYDNDRATDLLVDALDDEIERLTDETLDIAEKKRAQHADYALFLTEMVVATGASLSRDRFETLEEIEEFYWPSPAYKKRLRDS